MVIENPKIKNPNEYLDYLCQVSIEYGASDLYLSFWEEPTLRVFNQLYRLVGLDKMADEMLEWFASLFLTQEVEQEYFSENLSLDTMYIAHGRRFRVNLSKEQDHYMVVIRLLVERVPTLDELNMGAILKKLMTKTSGLIFVAGPTGSGKSTTLAAMIEEVNRTQSKHIITMEDPIEYVFEPKKSSIKQKQLGRDIVSFSSALKYALRQRPDIILFGEARDAVGIKNAIALAETGHLVLTTIHARSATQVIQKIISMFPAEEEAQVTNQMADILSAIIIQKLVKKIDQGMVPVQEILLNTAAIANTIREHKFNQIQNLIYANRAMGMQLLEDHLAYLCGKGYISIEEALANANDVAYLQTELQKLTE